MPKSFADFVEITLYGPWYLQAMHFVFLAFIGIGITSWWMQRGLRVIKGTHKAQFFMSRSRVVAQGLWSLGFAFVFILLIALALEPKGNFQKTFSDLGSLSLILSLFLCLLFYYLLIVYRHVWNFLNINEKTYLEKTETHILIKNAQNKILGSLPLSSIDEIRSRVDKEDDGEDEGPFPKSYLYFYMKKNSTEKVIWPAPWSYGANRAWLGLRPRYLVPDLLFLDFHSVAKILKEKKKA